MENVGGKLDYIFAEYPSITKSGVVDRSVQPLVGCNKFVADKLALMTITLRFYC